MTQVSTTAWALFIAVTLVLPPASAQPQKSPDGARIVQRIKVEGAQRIEPATVRSHMALTEGRPFSQQLLDQSLKALYDTGLFADVRIALRNARAMIVTVKVVESPTIDRIAVKGNLKVATKTLESELQLKPRMVFTPAKAQSDIQRIVEMYRRSGRFAAKVELKTVLLSQNRVDLVFDIEEGPTSAVNRIAFIGNREFSDLLLRRKISTSETKWWSFLQSSDKYHPERLAFDREQLRNFYLSRGYAAFRVISAVAELAPDRSGFTITFTIDEGDKYKFGKVEIDTELPIPPDKLLQLVRFRSGDRYNAELVEKSVETLTRAVGVKGHAFVEISPRTRRNQNERTVDVVFKTPESPRVYIERINIVGNTRTLDKVIRREICLVEGGPLRRFALEHSRARLRDLGFFKKVEITDEAGSAADRAVLNVEVEEDLTGEFFVSADSSSAELNVREKNLFGSGHSVSLRVGVGIPNVPTSPWAPQSKGHHPC